MAIPPRLPVPVPIPLRVEAISALLAIPAMAEPDSRNQIVQLLRHEVSTAIPRHPTPRTDVIGILDTCLAYPGAFDELVDTIRHFAAGTAAMDRLDAVAADIRRYRAGNA